MLFRFDNMQKEVLPPRLQNYIDGELEIRGCLKDEPIDFTVKAAKIMPCKEAFAYFGTGLFLLAITGFLVGIFFGPIFSGEEIHFTILDVAVTAGPQNLSPLIAPAIIIGIFALAGIPIACFGLYYFIADGPWYIGTAKKIVMYRKKIRTIGWSEFSEDIEIKGTAEKGDIILPMEAGWTPGWKSNWYGTYIGSKKKKIYITGIKDNIRLGEMIKKRINECKNPPAKYSEIYVNKMEKILTQ
jgi:hypothetical protein